MIETKFKNSEVGLIPEDWEVKPIGSVADILNGSTPPTANPENYGTTHLFVSPADLGDSKYIENTIKKLSTIGFSMSRKIPKGSILYTCTGSTIGKCGIAFCDLTSNQQINAVLPNGSYNNEYLYYAIQTRESDIRSNASVQAVPLINKTTFSKTLVAFPQKTEQSRIAEALSDMDDLIATTKKLIEKKRNIKKGAMHDLLSGKRRIVGFAKTTKCKFSEVGLLPEDWGSTSLSSIGEVKMCKRILKEQTSETGDVPFYKIGTFGKEADAYISRELFEFFTSKYPYPKKGTLLISAAGTIGRTVVFDGLDSYFQDSNIVWIDHKEEFVLNHYLEHYFKVIIWKSENGGTIRRLYNDNLRSTYLAFPKNKEEQQAIAQVLSDMDSEVQSLEVRLTKYQSMKQGMMQQLLTGKIRLI